MSAGALAQLAILGLLVAAIPLCYVWVKADADRFRKLVWVTLFLTFDLILFGAFTRLTDSGLGCPDWPGCYGQSNPVAATAPISQAQAAAPSGPVTFTKAWIEMIHRYLAMGVGVLIMTLMAASWSARAAIRRSPWAATWLFALVCVQGAFGAWTVTMKLMPVIVTIHLLLGVLLLCALGALGARTHEVAIPEGIAAPLRIPALIALATVFLQIALGGWVSTNYAVLACPDFPLCLGALAPPADFARGFDLTRTLGLNDDGSLLPLQALVAIHWVHRVFALVVTVVIVTMAAMLLRRDIDHPVLRRTGWALVTVLTMQLVTGVSNVLFAWPLAVAVLHNGGAALMALILATLVTRLAAARGTAPSFVRSAAGA